MPLRSNALILDSMLTLEFRRQSMQQLARREQLMRENKNAGELGRMGPIVGFVWLIYMVARKRTDIVETLKKSRILEVISYVCREENPFALQSAEESIICQAVDAMLANAAP